MKKHGFTIVELLIVIVVIAILAAITVVGFNGIQQRARNAQMITAAKSYQQAFMLYAADGNPYPTASPIMAAYGACLGDGYPGDRCWIGDNGNYRVEPTLDAALKPYINNKPAIPTKTYRISPNTDDRSGVTYFPSRANKMPYLYYLLDGTNQDCVLDSAVASNVGIGGTATGCKLVLPQQS